MIERIFHYQMGKVCREGAFTLLPQIQKQHYKNNNHNISSSSALSFVYLRFTGLLIRPFATHILHRKAQ
jgi:hypothetical protein